jgi:hypothetical protein
MTKEQVFMLYFACGYNKISGSQKVYTYNGIHNGIIKDINFKEWDCRSQDITDKWALPLREIEGMTDAEKVEFDKTFRYIIGNNFIPIPTFKTYTYLLSIGIDIDNFIEQGFAINQKDVK